MLIGCINPRVKNKDAVRDSLMFQVSLMSSLLVLLEETSTGVLIEARAPAEQPKPRPPVKCHTP